MYIFIIIILSKLLPIFNIDTQILTNANILLAGISLIENHAESGWRWGEAGDYLAMWQLW